MIDALFLFERLGTYVLTWSWQMAVLVVVAWIAVRLDRQHRPTLRHRVWVLTLLFGLLLPWIPERIAAEYWTQQVRQVLAPSVVAPSKSKAQNAGNAFVVPMRAMDKAQTTGVAHVGTTAPSGWNFSRPRFLQATGLLWLAGVVLAGFRRMREYRRLGRVASFAIALGDACTPPILFSPGVRTPMLYGWFRPVILLPQDVEKWTTSEERATMIRHESVHYARKDHWISAFEALVRTVFFFHPLARWTCRQVDIERELACDEEVLRRGAEPATYAEAIIKVAEHSVVGRAACGVYFAGAAQLDRRVELLFRTPQQVARSLVLLLPVCLLVVPTVALGFWQARAETPAPIEFKIVVNPIGLIPEEVLGPAPRPVPIAAETPLPVRHQDPPSNPPAPESPAHPRLNVALTKVNTEEIMTSITLGLPYSQLAFREDSAVDQTPIRRASGRVEIQITNLTGRIITRVDDSFEVMLTRFADRAGVAVYQKAVFLRPGLYRLWVVIHDSNSGTVFPIITRLQVPTFPADRLSASSLILADVLGPAPLIEVTPEFRIGSLRVRPNMSDFRRDQDLNIFQQVYVPAREAASTMFVAMETLITLDGREIKRVSELLQPSANLTITKRIPLADFTPGAYAIQTTYIDNGSGERVVSSGEFSVR
jgi:beta-lactamase regulating signal transducer with metallopeptidase domain